MDEGCRNNILSERLRENIKFNFNYIGMDIIPPADIIASLESIPFNDKHFDVVAALDVLEHVDNYHLAFKELCRVSNKYIFITYPYAYNLRSRVNIFLGRKISAKYGLPADPPLDRHKWFFSYNDAKNFNSNMAKSQGFNVISEGTIIGPRRTKFLPELFIRIFPNLFCPWYFTILKREHNNNSHNYRICKRNI